MRNSLREIEVQELNLKAVMKISEKARVRIVLKFLRDTGPFYRI